MNVKFRLSALWLVLAALLFCAPAAFAEDAPAKAEPYTIDYVAETLHFDDTKYTLTDAQGNPLTDAENAALGDGASLSKFIVTKGAEEPKTLILAGKDDATEDVTVTIPARPVAPALVPNWKTGTTIGIYYKNFRYWYTIDAEEDIDTLAAVQPLACLEKPIPLTASDTDSTLHVQSIAVGADNEAGTTPTFASAIATLSVPALREAPSGVTIKLPTTPDTITVSTLTDGEYCAVPTEEGSTANAFAWTALADFKTKDSAGNPILTGLTPGTEYTVKVRYAATGTDLPSTPLELSATTQRAGGLKIIPVDTDGKAFAGLAYNVWVPAPDSLTKDAPQTVACKLDDLKTKHGLEPLNADGSTMATDPEKDIQLMQDAQGAISCTPAEWKVTVKPTVEANTFTTLVKFRATGTAPQDAMWTYSRVGDVVYGDLGPVIPTGYQLSATESQAATAVAMQLAFVDGNWKALPEGGLTLTVESTTPSPSPTSTVAPTTAPTAAPTAVPTSVPTAAPTAAPADNGSNNNDSNNDSSNNSSAATAAPTEAPTAAPTVAPTVVPAPAPAPVSDPTAGRLMPGTTTTSANRNQQSTDGTTFTAKPEGSAKPSATPSASPTPSPKPTPSPTPEHPTDTPDEDDTPEDGATTGDETGKTPVWLNAALLAMAGGGLYALWFVMFHLPKKRAEELDLFKSDKNKSDHKDEE